MKFPYRKTIVSAALMLASSGLIMAQQTSTVQTSPAQRQTESVARNSPSPEEELQQSLLRIATIYREMAVTSPTDSVAVRGIKASSRASLRNKKRLLLRPARWPRTMPSWLL